MRKSFVVLASLIKLDHIEIKSIFNSSKENKETKTFEKLLLKYKNI